MFHFRTISQNYSITHFRLSTLSQINRGIQQLEGVISFADEIDSGVINKGVMAFQNGDNLPIEFIPLANNEFRFLINEIKREHSSEIKELKKEYFQNLQQNQDARIFSITKQRNIYTYKKIEDRRQNATLNFKKDSAIRKRLSIKKQNLFDLKVSNYNDSIANAIGFRRVNKAIADREKKRKAEELDASNKREAFYRSQAILTKKDNSENDLKSKLNTRHSKLKEKYAIDK